MKPLLLFFAAFALSLSVKAQYAYAIIDTVRLNAAYKALIEKRRCRQPARVLRCLS